MRPNAPIYDARVQLLPTPALIELHGEPDDLVPRLAGLGLAEPAPLRGARADGRTLLRPTPTLWVLLGAPGEGPELTRHLGSPAPAPDTLIVDLSDGHVHFALTGPEAAELLAVACPLDVHPRVFADDGAAHTEALGLRALVLRRPDGFHLAFERSHGPMVADWFARIQGSAADPSGGVPPHPGKPDGGGR